MQKNRARNLTGQDQWFRYWLPYQFVKLDVPGHKHVYLPVNRNYKPLGVMSEDWADYDDYLHQAVVFGADPYTYEDVWTDGEGLYLYDDNPASRQDYFKRLELLLGRSMKLYRP